MLLLMFSCYKYTPVLNSEAYLVELSIGAKSYSVETIIDENNSISITISQNIDLSDIELSGVVSYGATISPSLSDLKLENGVPQVLLVTAQDGTANEYTLTINSPKSTKASMISIIYNDKPVEVKSNVNINLSYGEEIQTITLDISEGATLKEGNNEITILSDLIFNDGIKRVFIVISEDRSASKEYSITINIEKSNSAKIISISYNNQDIEISDDIDVSSPSKEEIQTLNLTISTGAFISENGIKITNLNNLIFDDGVKRTFVVTSEDLKTSKEYSITISVEKANSAKIVSISYNNQDVEISDDIDVSSPYKEEIQTLNLTISAGASISENGIKITNLNNLIFDDGVKRTFVVTSEDLKTSKEYSIVVNISKNNEALITSLNRYGSSIPVTDIIELNLYIGENIGDSSLGLNISEGASLEVNGIEITNLRKVYLDQEGVNNRFIVTSEDKSTSKEYSITISKADFVIVFSVNSGDKIELPIYDGGDYDFKIDWHSSSGYYDSESVTSHNDAGASHIFDRSGDMTVIIKGKLHGFSFDKNSTSKYKIIKILRWGDDFRFGNEGGYFKSCSRLKTMSSINKPNMEGVTNMRWMFESVSLDDQSWIDLGINTWDVSSVTDMSYLFYGSNINHDLKEWDVSSVKNMRGMFRSATKFDKYIGGWNVSSVWHMGKMFAGASMFNQNIKTWNVSNVIYMNLMLANTPFNQDIGEWNVSNVDSMRSMFANTPFNQDIGEWDVSRVSDMTDMFNQAVDFNQNLSSWKACGVAAEPSGFNDGAINTGTPKWGDCSDRW